MVAYGCQGKGVEIFVALRQGCGENTTPALIPICYHARVEQKEESPFLVLHIHHPCARMGLEVSSMDVKRVNLYLDVELVKKLDEYAESRGISRTAAVSVILNEYFHGVVALDTLQAALKLINTSPSK